MAERGLVVLGSYDPSERDIECHLYFPWERIKIGLEAAFVKQDLMTSWYKEPTEKKPEGRPGMTITKAVKKFIPDYWTIKNWWEWAPKKGGVPYVKLYPKTFNVEKKLIPADYRSKKQLRFTYPRRNPDLVRKNKEITAGEKRRVWIPVPKAKKKAVRGSEKAVNSAKRVLINWLNAQGYMIPPFKEEEGGFKKEDFKGHASIGAQVKEGLEKKVKTDLSENEFALVIFDYDSARVPKRSYFAYDADWFTTEEGIQEVMRLANQNTGEWAGYQGEKTSRTAEGKLSEFV